MTPALDLDGPWKEALDLYLRDVFAFFFPQAHAEIDWSINYQWMDKELQQVAPEGDQGGQTVDKLAKVRLRDGQDVWVFIHLEIQSQHDPNFAQRMFRYHARLYDRYREEVISLAILGDTRRGWRPERFGYARWGCELDLTYPIVKLVDFDRAALEASINPCATVVLAHLDAQATRNDPEGRARAKVLLTRRLYGLGYDRVAIRQLYRFIDWLLRLPEDLERQTWQQIRAFEEEQNMTYVTYAERMLAREQEEALAVAQAEGRAEGRLEGLLLGIAVALDVKFGEAGSALMPEIRQIADPSRLEAIAARIRTASSVDDIRAAYAEGA